MKLKKLGKAMVAIILGATISFSAFAVAGCGSTDEIPNNPGISGDNGDTNNGDTNNGDTNNGDTNNGDNNNGDVEFEDPSKAVVTVTTVSGVTVLNAGSNATLTIKVDITGIKDKSYELSLSGDGASYVNRNDHVLSLKPGLTIQTTKTVTVTATSKVSNIANGSLVITIKPQVIDGNVDDLKPEMFEALGNPNITVTGQVKDVYRDLKNSANDVTNVYDYTVKMDDGAWYGEWNREGHTSKDISNYRRSEDFFESSGKHTVNRIYVNKNNEVAQKIEKDYMSVPAYWEDQHLWNHLADLGTDIENQWKHDATNDTYIYQKDPNEYNSDGTDFSDDMWLRTYLSVSLTPMLGVTLDEITIIIEDGAITKLIAQTAAEYDYKEDPSEMAYTVVECEFIDLGKTEVPEPEKYEGDEMTDILAAALAKMGNATNYTFSAVETTISGPSFDEGDYEFERANTSSLSSLKRGRLSLNFKSETGTEGLVGQITEDAVLLTKTGKYSATMDGLAYWHEYSGYKKINNDTYDYFEYDSSKLAFAGQKQFKGNFFDIMPGFDFAPELFSFVGDKRVVVGGSVKYYPQFSLKEPAITRDIAMEVSAHSYASNAQAATYGSFIITLTDDASGNKLYSIEYPYSLTSGTYLGIIETTYSKVGTTTLPEDWDAGYEARVIRDTWSLYDVKHYHKDHDTRNPYDEIDALTLLNQAFGVDNFDAFLPVKTFYNVFGDNMYGPFFNWEDIVDEETGEITGYQDFVTLNISVDKKYADENLHIDLETYNFFINNLTAELAKSGWAMSPANTGEKWGNRYIAYVKDNVMIKIENNKTRYFFVDIIPVGKWTLN